MDAGAGGYRLNGLVGFRDAANHFRVALSFAPDFGRTWLLRLCGLSNFQCVSVRQIAILGKDTPKMLFRSGTDAATILNESAVIGISLMLPPSSHREDQANAPWAGTSCGMTNPVPGGLLLDKRDVL
jgi:hypothetical protein